MDSINSIPGEILKEIFIYVTDLDYDYIDIFQVRLVNKQFCKIATPLRVRHWSDYGYYSPINTSPSRTTLNRFALELLRHPELRLQVKSVQIDWLRSDDGKETPRRLIRPENLALLARAAEETLPDLATVLVLAWTTNLTSLDLTIPSDSRLKVGKDYLMLVLYFAKQLALRFVSDDPKSTLPLPMEKLHTSIFRCWNFDREIHVAHLSPFLHFPNLKSLNALRIGDNRGRDFSYVAGFTENHYSMPFPERTSSLESIFLDDPTLSNAGFSSLLHACKNLKVFDLQFASALGTWSSTMLARALGEHASSLEEVSLSLQDDEDSQWVPDSADTDELPECYRELKRLKRAGIPMKHLLQREDENDSTTTKLNPGRLTESLEHLTIFHSDLRFVRVQSESFPDMFKGVILDTFESDRKEALVGIQTLLEETGPGGRLEKLKTVDFSDALSDDPMVEEIRRVKDLAMERGVEFILGKSIRRKFGKVPLRIFVGAEQMYFIPHGQTIVELFKSSRYLTTKTFGIMTVRDAFGLPQPDVEIYAGDNSGVDVKPAPGWEHVEQAKRFHFVQHRQLNAFLSGNALNAIISKFTERYSDEIAQDTTFKEDEWVEVDDLYGWFKNHLLRATTVALCGEKFLELSPDFLEDFWSFDYHLPNLFRRLPRWVVPKSYQARDRLLECLLRYHQYGQQNLDFTDQKLLEKDWTPEFGAKIMSTRQEMFKNIGLSPRGGAALDVGMIWAVNANAIPAAMWMLLGILLDKNLTDRVVAEMEPSFHEKSLSFDNDRLCSGPLLNSVYLEVLRVRVAAPVGRSSLISNLKFGKWQMKQDVGMLSTSWFGGHDPDFWNTGSTLPDGSEEHPVDTFWAERFLKYEDDPTGGPVRNTNVKPSTRTSKRTTEDDRKASVVTEGTQGYFYPYGGGTKMCPGRFFAKQKLMAGVALSLRAYEIELVDPVAAAKIGPNMDYFPFGTIPPKGKVPARIRRRNL
ncbi:hypothetical protein ACHAPZ_005614 [Fusarium culmorum]